MDWKTFFGVTLEVAEYDEHKTYKLYIGHGYTALIVGLSIGAYFLALAQQ